MNNKPNYSFVHSKKPMGRVDTRTEGQFNELFEDHKFDGGLERIVLEFTIKKWVVEQGVSFVNNPVPPVPSFLYVPIIYKAFDKPKRFLLWKVDNLIAYSSLDMGPWTFDKLMAPEQFIDFVMREAESLAQAFGLKVEVIYHGDPFYARKYLPQQQALHRSQKQK